MTDTGRIVIVGAGHNGLVCAAYLARAGREVTVLEASDAVGGMAATREFAPGYRASCAHLAYLLDAGIVKELALREHGLRFAAEGLSTVALEAGGEHLSIGGDRLEGAGLSASDRAAWPAYRRRMAKFAAFLGSLHDQAPPRIRQTPGDLHALAKLALRLRRMGRDDMREFLRIAGINVHDVLEEHFESPLLKGALALDALLGGFSGPRSNNTVFAALHRLSAGGEYAIPTGGMGAVTDALAKAAQAAGAELRTNAQVRRIRSDGLAVSGVELESGELIEAAGVISNADPGTTMNELLGPRFLEAETARRFRRFRARGNAAKLHLALDGLPAVRGLPEEKLGHRLLVAPDLDYLDRAFNPCKYRRFSPEPAMEITLPTVHDGSLAPEGGHVLSAIVQYAPFELDGGWEAGRGPFLEAIMKTLSRYLPGIRERVRQAELLTPEDLAARFGVAGGHWHHGELSLDQALMLRPVPRAARYRMPVEGLFLCGAGCHPGGGVMGHAGRNAARAVLDGDAP
jgi:phytoene dehydrogenase-like protein